MISNAAQLQCTVWIIFLLATQMSVLLCQPMGKQIEAVLSAVLRQKSDSCGPPFLKHKRTIQCYYCSYRTKSKILRNIKDEVNEHLKVEHREVINTFENEESVIENLLHAEFLELFLTD